MGEERDYRRTWNKGLGDGGHGGCRQWLWSSAVVANGDLESFLECSGRRKRRKRTWVNPIAGNVQLNTDGCWYDTNGRGGFGGLFRDHKGEWIMGFYGMRHFSTSLEAEIWSIYTGLRIILEKKLKNVTIESDSLTAVNLIKEGHPNIHPQSVLINEAHFIMTKTNTLIEHTYRSANQCADHLARMGVEQPDELVFVMDMPIALREFVLRDRLNIRQVLD